MASRKEKHKNVLELIESKMTRASIARSDAKAKKLLLGVRLAAFRRSVGVDQTRVKGFKQPAVSKIEGRSDIKLSTLVEYCRGLGAELKIVAMKKGEEFVLVDG